MKILITGNPNYAIGKALHNTLKDEHELMFYGLRTSATDLTNVDVINKFSEISLNYDVFINNASLKNFYQSILFDQVHSLWLKNQKAGHIINIGSIIDSTKEKQGMYVAEKVALRKFSEQTACSCVYKKSNIKVTYLAFGWVSTPVIEKNNPTVKKHSADEISKLVKWVLDYPFSSTNINEIRIEPIQ